MPQRKLYKELQLAQLRSFSLAAVRGNFTAAAEALNLSVSAVWQQVRALEQHVGASLLRRRGRAVELTPEGRLLLDLIQPQLSSLDALSQVFAARRRELPRQVSVAATEYILCYEVPRAVEQFAAAHPAVRLNLRTELPREVVRLVEEGAVDLGIASYDRDQPRSSVLDYQDIFEVPFQLLCSRQHPLAKKKRVALADLTDYPMIVPPRGGFSQLVLERLLQRHGLAERMNVMMESRSIPVVYHYAALGLGIALTYVGPGICRFLPDLCLRIFDPHIPTLSIAVLKRKGTHLGEDAERFRESVCSQFATVYR